LNTRTYHWKVRAINILRVDSVVLREEQVDRLCHEHEPLVLHLPIRETWPLSVLSTDSVHCTYRVLPGRLTHRRSAMTFPWGISALILLRVRAGVADLV
jgi:hypothetical protein